MKFLQQTAASPNVAQGASSTGVTGPMVQGIVLDTISNVTEGVIAPFSMTTKGQIRVSTDDDTVDFLGGPGVNWSEVTAFSEGIW